MACDQGFQAPTELPSLQENLYVSGAPEMVDHGIRRMLAHLSDEPDGRTALRIDPELMLAED